MGGAVESSEGTVQKLVLYSLAQLGLYERYTLRGDAALRLFYGSPRRSPYLDFMLSGSIGDPPLHADKLGRALARALAPERVDVATASVNASTRPGASTGTSPTLEPRSSLEGGSE